MLFAATWMELETHTKRRQNLIYGTKEPIYREGKKPMHLENRLVVAKGEEDGVGWTGSLGLVDANYCIWSG